MEKNKNNIEEQMENVSGGQITSSVNVTLTGDDALAYLNSDLYKNSKNNQATAKSSSYNQKTSTQGGSTWGWSYKK